MDIKKLVIEWLEASNSYDTKKYLEKYSEDAVLNDSSLNLKFVGRDEIRDYYNTYFIGYKTQTRLVKFDGNQNEAHLEVEFTGEFPEGQIGGLFDITFKNGKIDTIMADLT